MSDYVLVVDDEEDICDFLKEAIEELHLSVACAHTGDDALKILKEKKDCTLALVDLKLPTHVTGLDVIKEIKKANPKTVVIAMTGYIDGGLKKETEYLKVNHYFEKPGDVCDYAQVQEKISKLLSLPRI